LEYAVAAVGRTHPGKVRANNEDSYHIGARVLIVADGVGGNVAGEVASQTVVSVFAMVDESDPDDDVYEVLTAAVARSSDAICQQVEADPRLAGMSTTATVMMACDRRIVFAQIGDSRAYFLRRRPLGRLHQVTRDDSFVQFLVDTGQIDAEEARTHPNRNVILKALDGQEVAPSFATYVPMVGDRYLLCSDGLTDYVHEDDVLEALTDTERDDAADHLIDLALAAGAPDNVTVIVADLVAPAT
jgi:protein phosphatase